MFKTISLKEDFYLPKTIPFKVQKRIDKLKEYVYSNVNKELNVYVSKICKYYMISVQGYIKGELKFIRFLLMEYPEREGEKWMFHYVRDFYKLFYNSDTKIDYDETILHQQYIEELLK